MTVPLIAAVAAVPQVPRMVLQLGRCPVLPLERALSDGILPVELEAPEPIVGNDDTMEWDVGGSMLVETTGSKTGTEAEDEDAARSASSGSAKSTCHEEAEDASPGFGSGIEGSAQQTQDAGDGAEESNVG